MLGQRFYPSCRSHAQLCCPSSIAKSTRPCCGAFKMLAQKLLKQKLEEALPRCRWCVAESSQQSADGGDLHFMFTGCAVELQNDAGVETFINCSTTSYAKKSCVHSVPKYAITRSFSSRQPGPWIVLASGTIGSS